MTSTKWPASNIGIERYLAICQSFCPELKDASNIGTNIWRIAMMWQIFDEFIDAFHST